jgi:ceramide glucosyltransferase
LPTWTTHLAVICTALYLIDRAWKAAAIAHFFRQPSPPDPQPWPALSLVQPVTTSPNALRAVLAIRSQNPYPGPLEQVLVFDDQDDASLAICTECMARVPGWQPKIVRVPSPSGTALKTVKQLAGLREATGAVICFVDDDILLRADTLATLVRHLRPGTGATFGLACYTNWQTLWGGLMSAFVNANALLNYIPITYLSDPYTITGHIYALYRADFDAIGGLDGMESRLDDDHELARRVMQAGLHNCQTPALYDVDNELTLRSFLDQVKRWFVFPRECMLPGISPAARWLTYATTLPNLLPGLVLVLAFFSRPAGLALAACLVTFYALYIWGERCYLASHTPGWAWPGLLWVALLMPFHILGLLFSSNTIRWRGQQIRVRPGGEYELRS